MRIHARASVIGVDVGSRWIKAVQLVGSGADARVRGASLIPVGADDSTEPGAIAKRVAGVLRRQGFVGNRVALAAPDDALMVTPLELPPKKSGAPVEELAGIEVGRIHKVDAGSMELALWDVPSPARASASTSYMAASCGHEQAERVIVAFEESGLEVVALDVRPFAVARGCWSGTGAPGMVAVLDVSWGPCTVWFYAGGTLVYERRLEGTGLGAVHKQLVEQVSVDAELAESWLTGAGAELVGVMPEDVRSDIDGVMATHWEGLSEHLRLSYSYVRRRYTMSELAQTLLVGDLAAAPGLATRCAGLGTAARVVTAQDLACGGSTEGYEAISAAFVGALGLARYDEGSDA